MDESLIQMSEYERLLFEVGSVSRKKELDALWPRVMRLPRGERADLGEQIAMRFPDYEPPAGQA